MLGEEAILKQVALYSQVLLGELDILHLSSQLSLSSVYVSRYELDRCSNIVLPRDMVTLLSNYQVYIK